MEDPTLNFETYAATLQQVMQAAIQKAEALQKEAEDDREAAFADQDAERNLLHEWDHESQRKAEDDALRRYPKLKEEMIAALAAKLEKAGKSADQIALVLQALSGSR